MSSILTNNSAMVALQTLKSVNKNLSVTQNEISTGKSVSSAKDNAAIWSISKQMDSDVKGFNAISESLNLGQATVATARNAAETVTDLLTEMKGRIVAAQEENVDRESIQADIVALRDQIGSVVNAAQFNGLNLIDGSSADSLDVLSSLDRDASGDVSASKISIDRQNLSVTDNASTATFGTATDQAAANALISSTGITNARLTNTGFDPSVAADTNTVSNNGSTTIEIGQVTDGASYQIAIADLEVNVVGGGTTTGTRTFDFVAGANDGVQEVTTNLVNQMNAFFGAATDGAAKYVAVVGDGDDTNGLESNQITITNGDGGTSNGDIVVGLAASDNGTAGTSASSGGLGALSTIDVTTDSGATGALEAIDGLISQSINAAASFGSDQGRIETQSEFVTKLSDSLKSGIGAMVDADMEETSARLQALQVQQQLAVQSLSIANQAPQSILSLFR